MRPVLDPDQEAGQIAEFMLRYADSTLRWNRQACDKPKNELQFKIDRETDGALRNQIYLLGHFDLEDEEALVIDVDTGGAGYFVAPITNCWGTTNEIIHRTGSLNLAQSLPNADGSLTYVASREDPGVPNWLDPSDLREGILTLRWAELASGRPTPQVGARSRVVPLGQLRDALPRETGFVSAEERTAQCAHRAAGYMRRLPEG